MDDRSTLLSLLTSNPDFTAIRESTLLDLLQAGTVRDIADEEIIVHQGKQGQGIWILIEGDFEVTVNGTVVNHIHIPGEVIGQISAISQSQASATVYATKASRCLFIPHQNLHALLHRHPGLAAAFLRSMVKYLGKP